MSTIVALLALQSAACVAIWALALRRMNWTVAALVIGFFAGCLVGPSFWLMWLGCGLTAVVFAGRKWSYRASLVAVAVVAILAGGVRSVRWSRDIADFRALQAEFPVQPLQTRLSRLQPVAQDLDAPVTALHAANRPVQDSSLGELEQSYHERWPTFRRQQMLRSLGNLHSTVERQFQQREGFGVIRSLDMWPRREYLELPTPEPIPQTPASDDAGSLPAWTELGPVAPPQVAELETLHREGQLSFIDPRSLGYFNAGKQQAVGFQAHAFRTRPTLTKPTGAAWQVSEVELVSLLKETSPAVYQSDHLPNLEHITHNDVPLRPLDEFETTALARLQRGEDVVVDEHPDQIRILGSLRAVRQCTECHSVERGTLLGAFTYRLQPPAGAAVSVEGPKL